MTFSFASFLLGFLVGFFGLASIAMLALWLLSEWELAAAESRPSGVRVHRDRLDG